MKIIVALLFAAASVAAQTDQSAVRWDAQDSAIPVIQPDTPSGGNEKSVSLAALYSFLLPGMGELYVGDYSTGKYLTVIEGVLWVTLIGFDQYGTWVKNDARDFAVEHAGIALVGQKDQYFVDLGDYQTIHDYNVDMLRKRDLSKIYDERYPMGWNWDSKSNREYYRDMRVKSDNAYNNVSFVVAAIGVNHLVSAVNAALSARSHNNETRAENSVDIRANVLGGIYSPHGISITLTKIF